jgi:hypothetical protein
MKKILVSSALTLSAFFVLASGSANAQSAELFFPSGYDRPAENVWGLNLGTTVGTTAGSPLGSPYTAAAQTAAAPAVAARRHQLAHVH